MVDRRGVSVKTRTRVFLLGRGFSCNVVAADSVASPALKGCCLLPLNSNLSSFCVLAVQLGFVVLAVIGGVVLYKVFQGSSVEGAIRDTKGSIKGSYKEAKGSARVWSTHSCMSIMCAL